MSYFVVNAPGVCIHIPEQEKGDDGIDQVMVFGDYI
jgi:hypothetical protein